MGNATLAFENDGIPQIRGQLRRTAAVVTLSNSYATGGDSIPAGSQKGGLSSVLRARVRDQGNHGYILALDSRTAPTKVLAYWSALNNPLAEVTATTDLAAVTCVIEWEGY